MYARFLHLTDSHHFIFWDYFFLHRLMSSSECVWIKKLIIFNLFWNKKIIFHRLSLQTITLLAIYEFFNIISLQSNRGKRQTWKNTSIWRQWQTFYDLYIFNQPFCANACQFQTHILSYCIFPIVRCLHLIPSVELIFKELLSRKLNARESERERINTHPSLLRKIISNLAKQKINIFLLSRKGFCLLLCVTSQPTQRQKERVIGDLNLI